MHGSYQFLPQPGQCTLYVQLSASLSSLAEALCPTGRTPADALSRWLTVVKGGALAGEVPQLGENHFHHVRPQVLWVSDLSECSPVSRCVSAVWEFSLVCVSWDESRGLLETYKGPTLYFSPLVPPLPKPRLSPFFICLLFPQHYMPAPWWTDITRGWMWWGISDVSALSRCLTWWCLLLGGLFIGYAHTHTHK